MNVESILQELRSERERIDQAISALQAIGTPGNRTQPGRRRGRPPGGSAAKSSSATKSASTKSGNGRRRRRGMSPEARKRISEMMKARWAQRRKAAKNA